MARKPASKKTAQPGLPSREEILEFISSQPGKIGKREIARAFGLKGAQRIPLKKLLKEMIADGDITGHRSRLNRPGNLPPVAVLIIERIDEDGELIAVPQNWDAETDGPLPEVILSDKSAKGAGAPSLSSKPGERVLARIRPGDFAGYRFSATIMRRLVNETPEVLGIIRKSSTGLRLVPVDKKAKHELEIMPGADKEAKTGELVRGEIARERRHGLPMVRIIERLGDFDNERNYSQIAIHQHGIPHRFSNKVIAETEKLGSFSAKSRIDLRNMPLITIDPADARDHDDAVYARADEDPENPGGFKVTVAIADVAAYVRPGTALDDAARERGNSVYFPDRVVPMLPEKISNDLCSLREGEDRPALACHLVFDAKGKKRTHRFERIIMRSAASLSYEQAQAAFDGKADDQTAPLVEPVLAPLRAAHRAVEKARLKRQPLELELPERRLILNEAGEVMDVVTPPRLDAHRLIEEFMIQANVAAAESLEKAASVLIYRVHEAPSAEKLIGLADFLQTIGLNLAKGQVMKPMHFNRILAQARGKEYEDVLSNVVLRSQAQAVYSHENRGHFGLNLRRYAHFTSPIRRYADLIVHRALIGALNLGKDGLSPNDIKRLEETAELISASERRAMMAERDTKDRLIAAFLSSQLRARFQARISGAVGAGLFVTLEDTGADGFVPAASISGEFFRHDPASQALIGDSSGETYQLGDKVEVRLIEAAPVSGGLRFELLSEGKKGKPIPRHRRQNRRLPSQRPKHRPRRR